MQFVQEELRQANDKNQGLQKRLHITGVSVSTFDTFNLPVGLESHHIVCVCVCCTLLLL